MDQASTKETGSKHVGSSLCSDPFILTSLHLPDGQREAAIRLLPEILGTM